jgi:diketogulonate reductase-like aldo/keto reductase
MRDEEGTIVKAYELTTGYQMPALGLGTWQLKGNTCTRAVQTALEAGYDHIDTADMYGNHRAIRRALQDFDPEEIFITSKIWRSDLRHDDVLAMGDRALSELGVDYLDLLLIHWPNDSVPVEETLGAMAALVEQGKVRSIGVSNFMIHHLEEALAVTEAPIAVNQVKFHPYHNQRDLLAYCKEHDIVVTAYSPFGNGSLIGDPALKGIADKYDKTHTQVVLKWLVTKGIVVIPKSTDPNHIRANMDIFDWELDNEDYEAIEALD